MARCEIKNVVFRGVFGTTSDNKVNIYDFSSFNERQAETFVNIIGVKNRYVADY